MADTECIRWKIYIYIWSFRFTTKLEGRHRDFLLLLRCTACLMVSLFQERSAWVTRRQATLMSHSHLRAWFTSGCTNGAVHSRSLHTQAQNDACPSLYYTEDFHHRVTSSGPYLWQPLTFPRMSHSWNHTVWNLLDQLLSLSNINVWLFNILLALFLLVLNAWRSHSLSIYQQVGCF